MFEHGDQAFFRSVPCAVILIHHDEVRVVRGFFLGVGAVGDVVVGEGDEASRIEFVDPGFNFVEIGAAAFGAHVAFVANAPGEDAGMIGGLFDHFLKHLLSESNDFGIGKLLAGELPDGNFGDEKNSMLIGVFEDLFVLRIVDGPRERCVKNFEVIVVVLDGAGSFGEAFPGRFFVASHAREPDLLAVEVEMAIVDFDLAIAEGINLLVNPAFGVVDDAGANRVEIGVVEVPELGVVDGKCEFDGLLGAWGYSDRLCFAANVGTVRCKEMRGDGELFGFGA